MPDRPAARHGSDLVVDLLMESGIEHVAFNPGASFRGIHDSLVHTSEAPEITLCLHEMIAVSMAQGYAKAAGRPMAVLLHNVVGLQNASMAIYNAWCDRVPMLLLGGTGPKSTPHRRPWIDWIHTASVQANLVRDFVKWDDEPHDIHSVEESFARALTATRSAPTGPVYLCYDVDLQEDPLPADLSVRGVGRYPIPSSPAPSPEDLRWIAEQLRAARRPVILAGYAGESPEAFADLVALAETLGAPVVDTGVRHAFPTTHPLAATHVDDVLDEADVVLALDVEDIDSRLRSRYGDAGLSVGNVSLANLKLRAWAHDYQAMVPADRQITASADHVVSGLLRTFEDEPLAATVVDERITRTTALTTRTRDEAQRVARSATADGCVPLERLLIELADALDGTDFVLGGGPTGRLEHRDLPRLPQALWTAANKSLPVLIVVNNNRQYGNTVEHAMKIGEARGRQEDRRYAGAGLADPAVDLAAMARSFGVWGVGPITDPESLAEQLAAAVEVVRSGKPALIDVVTPGF